MAIEINSHGNFITVSESACLGNKGIHTGELRDSLSTQGRFLSYLAWLFYLPELMIWTYHEKGLTSVLHTLLSSEGGRNQICESNLNSIEKSVCCFLI